MYRIAVCGDEPVCLKELALLSRFILSNNKIEGCVSEFSSFAQLKSAMGMGVRFDLFLLNILSDGPEGLDFARLLRSLGDQAGIVFVSSGQDYHFGGYDVHAIQYLLKPPLKDKLEQAIRFDYRRCVSAERRIRLAHRDTVLSLNENEVLYLESKNRQVHVHTDEGERTLPGTLKEYEFQLPAASFARCHISFCVNLRRVKTVTWGQVTLHKGIALPISRKYYRTFQTAFWRF